MSSDDDSFEFEDDGDSLAVGAVGEVVIANEPVLVESEEKAIEKAESEHGGEVKSGESHDKEADEPFEMEENKQEAPSMSHLEDVSRVDEKTSFMDGIQGTIDELFSLPNTLSKPKTPPRQRKRVAKRKPTAEKVEDKRHIPILNRDTENKDTYDLDYLMEAQKVAKAKHRFVTVAEEPKPEKTEEVSDVDFIRKNIEETQQSQKLRTPQSSMCASLSLDYFVTQPKTERKSMNQKQSSEFVDRLLTYRKQVQDKVKQTQQELQLRETQSCTFTPALAGTKAAGPRRKPEDMYYAGVTKAKELQQKQDRMREEQETETSTFRPSVNQQSLKLLEKRKQDQTPVYEKLYSAHKEEVKKQIQSKSGSARSKSVGHDIDLTFKPSINKRSEEMSRGKKVNEVLYEDAKRRTEKMKEVPKLQPFEPKLSKNSEKVLVTKFEEEFAASWTRFAPENSITSQTILRQFLEDLRFDPEKGDEDIFAVRVWDTLEGTQRNGITRRPLLSFLKALLHFKPGPKQTAEKPASDGRFGVIEGDEFLMHPKDVLRIQKTFDSVYEARLASGKKSAQKVEAYTFKPDISKSSKARTGRSRSSSVSSLSEARLMGDPAKLEAKIKQAKEQMEKEKMAECTFRPKLKKSKFAPDPPTYTIDDSSPSSKKPADRNAALYQLAKLTKARKEKLAQEKVETEREKETTECTFSPNVDLFQTRVKDESMKAEGVSEAIERMRKAREEKEKLRLAAERGEPVAGRPATARDSLGSKRTPGIKTPSSKPAPVPPQSNTLSASEIAKKLQAIPQNEIMTVAINVKPGVTEDLTLYEGDDLMSVVSAFANRHGLPQEEAVKLRALISEQLLGKD